MRKSGEKGLHSVGGVLAKGLFRLIISNPLVTTIVIVLVVAFIAYTLYSIDYQLTQILEQYQSLSSRQLDSKSGFDKRLFYITLDNNGKTKVTVGYSSEVAEETAQEAVSGGGTTTAGGHTVNLSADASKVRDALLETDEFKKKADSLALAYQLVMDTFDNPNAAIGLMANIAAEGNYGVVEHAFSLRKPYGFGLPSGGTVMKTVEDIDYLLNWDSTTSTGDPKIGSCGVGSVQWSYGRRIGFLKVVKGLINDGMAINDDMWSTAEATYIMQEFQPGGGYYTKVLSHVSSNTAEEWAEAFCDYYEIPGGSCGSGKKMTQSGSACVTRRANASKLADILEGIE